MMMIKKIVISKNQKGYFTQTKLKTCSLTNPAVRDGADCPKMEFFIRNRFGSMSAPTPTNINDQNSRDTSFITTLNSSMQETYSLHKAQLFHPKVILYAGAFFHKTSYSLVFHREMWAKIQYPCGNFARNLTLAYCNRT